MEPAETGSPEPVRLSPMTVEDARTIVRWRYDPDYAVYDLGPEHLEMLTEPANRYFAIRRHGELVGHVCIGVEARVAGQSAEPDTADIGLGFRPDLVGRGEARRVLPLVLAALDAQLDASRLRVVVAAWNRRARAAARGAGFQPVGEHVNSRGRYVILSRDRSNPVV